MGKGTKVIAITDTSGTVLSIAIESASPHEVPLVKQPLEERFTEALPEKLIGDRVYNSDELDERLKEMEVEMIASHRRN